MFKLSVSFVLMILIVLQSIFSIIDVHQELTLNTEAHELPASFLSLSNVLHVQEKHLNAKELESSSLNHTYSQTCNVHNSQSFYSDMNNDAVNQHTHTFSQFHEHDTQAEHEHEHENSNAHQECHHGHCHHGSGVFLALSADKPQQLNNSEKIDQNSNTFLSAFLSPNFRPPIV